VFLVYFPITFTLAIINVWLKTIPNPNLQKGDNTEFTKEETEGITHARASIKEFTHGLIGHLKSLYDYLESVIAEKPLLTNFGLIREQEEFKEFSDVFGKTKHTGVTPTIAEEFFSQTFEKLQESYHKSIQQVSRDLLLKIGEIQMDLFKKL